MGAPHVSPASLPREPSHAGPAGSSSLPGVGDRVSYRRLLHWSWVLVRDAWGLFLVGTALSLLAQTLAQYDVQLLSVVLAGLGGGAEGARGGGGFLDALVPQSLATAGVLFAVLLFVQIGLNLANRLAQAMGDNLMSSRLQGRLHDRLLSLGPEYHLAHDVGSTQIVVNQFAVGSQALFKDLIAFPLLRGVGLVTALVLLVGNLQKIGGAPAWMTILLLGLVVVLPVGTIWLSGKVRRAYAEVREAQKTASEELLNSLSQPLEVQVLRAEAPRGRSYRDALGRLLRLRTRASMRNEFASQFQNATPDLLRAVFIVYAVFFALRAGDPAAVGPIVAIFFFVPEAVRPLQDILQFFMGLNATWPQIQSVVEVLEAEPAVRDRPGAVDAPEGPQTLSLEGVTFSYTAGGRRILDGLSHAFEPGAATAVVARSGGGKSTLFNVLCRLQDPQEGTVRFGGRDVRDLRISSYRTRVTKVSQFPLLIMDTLRENFLLAAPDATDEAIRAACVRTGLWREFERIDGRPADALDYVLPRSWDQGPSGGQRRLLAITRALLTRPSVLLVDEPTTGIDAVWRDRLVGLVRELAREMTVIVVDHNVRDFLSRVADRVCVLEEGRFTQVGTPEELARVPGLFRTLCTQAEPDTRPPSGPPSGPPQVGASARERKGGTP